MIFLRMEVFEKNELVYIREKPVFAKTQKGIKATNTRLVNWAQKNFPEWTEVTVQPIERPRAVVSQVIDSNRVTSP
jgi:hypothetical protein